MNVGIRNVWIVYKFSKINITFHLLNQEKSQSGITFTQNFIVLSFFIAKNYFIHILKPLISDFFLLLIDLLKYISNVIG